MQEATHGARLNGFERYIIDFTVVKCSGRFQPRCLHEASSFVLVRRALFARLDKRIPRRIVLYSLETFRDKKDNVI